MQELEVFKNVLNFQLKQAVLNVNSEFTSAAVDTGLLLNTIKLAQVNVDFEELRISVEVDAPAYLIFVENGWGGNRTYGERRVREVAMRNPDAQAALQNLLDAMINKYLQMDQPIKSVKIRI